MVKRLTAFKPAGTKQLAVYGACGGLLIASIRLLEYRVLVVERSTAAYVALVAAACAIVGLTLGARAARRRVVVKEVVVPAEPFVADEARIDALGITPRELEVLQLMAEGLSNKEMAERLFVSENTVKTHASRVFDKLGAGRRTQAVQIAKTLRIIA